MNLRTLVWRELFERKSQMLTITVGIFLGTKPSREIGAILEGLELAL